MTKIFSGRAGEGSSNRSQKRQRVTKISSGRADEGSSNRRQTRQSERLRQKRLRVTGENSEKEQRNIDAQTEMDHTGSEESEPDQEAYSIDTHSLIDGRNQSTPVFITNPSGLDCFICYEALTIPVLECKNGHIVCYSCCVKLNKKCPLCSELITNPCHAMENVLKSVQVSCTNAPHGCEEIISYNNKKDHEKECSYIPCYCPHLSCNDFSAPPRDLALHFSDEHGWPLIYFEYHRYFSVTLTNSTGHEVIVLKEKNNGNLFLLHSDNGGRVYVSYTVPRSSNPAFQYEVSSSRGLEVQAVMSNCHDRIAGVPEVGFPYLPSYLFDHGQLKLDLRIWRGGSFKIFIDLSDD